MEMNKLKEKILLALLPFWSPLIPPMGISCLKSYLQDRGYRVKTLDLNIEEEFKDIYNRYFAVLKASVPDRKQGNFYSIGQDVLHNHLMASFNLRKTKNNDPGQNMYLDLVGVLIDKTFYCQVETAKIIQLNQIIQEFYTRLRSYMIKALDEEKPDVLGLSVCSGTLPASLFTFKLAKEKFPSVKTVMGGGIFCDQFALGTPDFETLMEETGEFIDHFVVGEGEILFLKLLQSGPDNTRRVYTIEDIKGEYLDLSSAAVPDFRDYELQHYPYLSAYASRSCPHQCKFCSDTVMWGKYRKKSAQQVVREMTRLYEEFGYQLFMMSDLLLNPVVTDLAQELIDSDESFYWDGCLRAEKPVCNKENTLLWRQGGFYQARIGCESGSPRMLELMGKKITIEQIKKAISSLAFAGIQITSYWVLGYPGETEEDFRMTLDLIEELREDIYEAECRPFYYYLTGQVNSETWAKQSKSIPLYPEKFKRMLSFQTYILDEEPCREVTYQRVNRFVEHCNKLEIPNPYTMKDIYEADERWKKLHKNAVPSLLDLKNKDRYIDECKKIQQISLVDTTLQDEGDFGF